MITRAMVFCNIILFIAIFNNLTAMADDNAIDRLLRAKSLKCTFGEGYTAIWEDGRYEITKGRFWESADKSTIYYYSINYKNHTVRMIGNQCSTNVSVIATENGITFIEKTNWGNLMITTVFAYYANSSKKEFVCVFSRHVGGVTGFKTGPMPSQWTGTCKIWE